MRNLEKQPVNLLSDAEHSLVAHVGDIFADFGYKSHYEKIKSRVVVSLIKRIDREADYPRLHMKLFIISPSQPLRPKIDLGALHVDGSNHKAKRAGSTNKLIRDEIENLIEGLKKHEDSYIRSVLLGDLKERRVRKDKLFKIGSAGKTISLKIKRLKENLELREWIEESRFEA